MKRALIAALALALLVPTGVTAQEVPTDEWCKTFLSLTRTYWLGEDYSEQAVSDAYDAVTEEDVIGCQSALNMMEAQGIRAASGLEELGFEEAPPAPEPEATAPPTSTPKLPKPDYRATADRWSTTYGPGKKKPFADKSLKVWVNDERAMPDRVNGKKGTFSFYGDLEEGDVIRATYKRTKYTPPPVTRWDGTYRVGKGIKPGLYRTRGKSCYYARLRNLKGGVGSIIDNHFGDGNQVLRVFSSDNWVELDGGCTWRRVGN